MKDKYYTPDISEFHVGFSYRYNVYGEFSEHPMGIRIFDSTKDLNEIKSEIETECLGVKYLDGEDIESLGFNLIEIEPHDLYSREVDEDHTWLLVPHFFEEGCELRVWITSKSSVIKGGRFDGIIKNKSELKSILKMIGYEKRN